MAGKTHPYLTNLYMSALVFFSSLLIIIFIALYVQNKAHYEPNVAPQVVEENLTPPGKIYPRQ